MNQQLHHSIPQRTRNVPLAASQQRLIDSSFLILAFSACCSIVKKNLLGKIFKFANGIFSSYWHFLNQAVDFIDGSQHGL